MNTTINLATRRYYNRTRFRFLLLGVLIVLLILSGIAGTRLFTQHAESSRLAAEIATLDQRLAGHPSGVTEQEFSQQGRQLAAINTLLAQRSQSRRRLLDSLETALPAGIAYTQIVPEQKDKLVKLEGIARSLAVLSELLERLGSSTSGFRKPTLVTTEDLKQKQMPGIPSGVRFVITVGWDGP